MDLYCGPFWVYDEFQMNLPPHTDSRRRLYALLLRLALGTAFLSAVADRFGLWGTFGQPNVAWGDMPHFLSYTARVVSYLPAALVPAVGWLATIAEIILGIGLLLGLFPRIMALGSAALLLLFALSMSVSLGVKSALNFSVFTASAAAFLLFASEQQSDPNRAREQADTTAEASTNFIHQKGV